MTRTSNFAYHNKYSDAAKAMPHIKVYFLQASRSIRTTWLLEELGLPYELEFANRENQKAPQEFKDASGNPLGKFPTLVDGDMVIYESGAISDYLCEKYDVEHRLIPQHAYLRARVQTFVHAAEGTLMLHALAILYARWNFPAASKEADPGALAGLEKGMSVNVQSDLDWLQSELAKSTGLFLVGNGITAADVMMLFSVQFIMARQLGTGDGKTWPKLEEWMKRCEATDSYNRAVERSGHTLHPSSI